MTTSHKWHTYILVILVLAHSAFFAGIVFGWAPMQLMLQEEQQYIEFCRDGKPCNEQFNQFNLIFTVGVFAVNFSALPIGVLIDLVQPMWAMFIAGIVQMAGMALFALCDSKSFDYFILSYCLIGVGGYVGLFVSYKASFLIPSLQNAVLSGSSCLFDGSTIVFQLLYWLHTQFSLSRQEIFFGYLAFGITIYSVTVVLWYFNEHLLYTDVVREARRHSTFDPNPNFQSHINCLAAEETTSETSPLLSQVVSSNNINNNNASLYGPSPYGTATPVLPPSTNAPSAKITEIKAPVVPFTERSIWYKIFSHHFLMLLAHTTIGSLRCNVYIGTQNQLFLSLGDRLHGFFFTQLFGFILPLGGVCAPIVERTLSVTGLVPTVHVTNALGIIYNAFQYVQILWVQSVANLVFTVYRAYFYSVNSALSARVFGLKHVSTILGAATTFGAITNLLQEPAVAYANEHDNGSLTMIIHATLAMGIFMAIYTEVYRLTVRRRGEIVR